MCVCRFGWRLMRGKTKSLFSLNFFSKNSRRSCDCPIKLHSHLLAVYPRSVGGLQGRLRLAVWGVMPQSCENRPMMGMNSTQIFFLPALQVHMSFTRSQKGRRRVSPTPSSFCRDCPFFSSRTRLSSSQWHRHNFSLSHHFFISYAEEHVLKISPRKRTSQL